MPSTIGYAPTMIERSLFGIRRCSLAIWSIMLFGCMTQVQKGFDDVHIGMTQEEVRSELGEPSVRIPPRLDEEGSLLDGGRWQYADNLSSLTNAAAFPEFVPDRVWVVWFDVEGTVQRTRRPIRVEAGTEEGGGETGGTPLFPPSVPPRGR
jgi:hypothetical protein